MRSPREEGDLPMKLALGKSNRTTATSALLLLLICWQQQPTLAFPSGAPDKACKDLRPGHGYEPTTEASPFQLTQDKLQATAGDQIRVKLSAKDDSSFKGLMVQAVDEKGDPQGKFLAGAGLKVLATCSAVTHSDREPKKTATLVWEAPAEFKTKKSVSFKATVVQQFDKIFADIKSTLAAS